MNSFKVIAEMAKTAQPAQLIHTHDLKGLTREINLSMQWAKERNPLVGVGRETHRQYFVLAMIRSSYFREFAGTDCIIRFEAEIDSVRNKIAELVGQSESSRLKSSLITATQYARSDI